MQVSKGHGSRPRYDEEVSGRDIGSRECSFDTGTAWLQETLF